MREPTENFASLLELINSRSKRDLVRLCKTLSIHQQDFVWLILATQHGEFHPYKYANHFQEFTPENLVPTEQEQAALAENGVGKFKTRGAQKFSNKIFQLFKERRLLAAHLLYTPDHKYWHLFYFDNRDHSDINNHWKHGPHLHYVSDLWPELTMEAAWKQVVSGQLGFSNKLHIRYISK